jgi:Anaphase-promoting complex subunit 4 WD40 domain
MSIWSVAGGVVLALAVNEFCDVCPWGAAKLVRWSARLRYTDPERAEVRAEELAALIESRPGKLFKLITALGFVLVAIRAWAERAISQPLVVRPGSSAGGTVTLTRIRVTMVIATVSVISAILVTYSVELQGVWRAGPPTTPPTGQLIAQLSGASSVTGLAYNSDGKFLAIGSSDGPARIWSLAAMRMTGVLGKYAGKGVAAVAFNSAGNPVTTADSNDHAYWWTPRTTASPLIYPSSVAIEAMAFSGDGKYLATSFGAGYTGIERVGTYRPFAVAQDPHSQGVRSVTLNLSGAFLAVADDNGHAYLWHTRDFTSTSPIATLL